MKLHLWVPHQSMLTSAYILCQLCFQVYVDDERNIDNKTVPVCTCERGQFRCHHMAVVMLHAYKNVSSTDNVCKWSRPKSSAARNVYTVSEMYPDTKPTGHLDRPVSDEDRQSFVTSLQQVNTPCAFSWFLSPEPVGTVCSVPSVSEVVHTHNLSPDLTPQQLADLMGSLCVTQEQIRAVEMGTKNQHNNPLWGHYRSGRLTASNFGAIVKCVEGNRKPSASLLKTLTGEYDASGAKAVQWGLLHEKTAVTKYESERNVTVQPAGLWLHPLGFCGGSPDGIVDDRTLIEVKCPFAARKGDLLEHIGDKFFLHYNSDNAVAINVHNTQGHSYYHQIQGYLWLTGRSVCNLIVWTPDTMIMLAIEKDDQYEVKYMNVLKNFYEEHYIKHFIDRCVQ